MEDPFKDDTLLARWLAGELSEAEERELRARPDFTDYERLARHGARLRPPDYNVAGELERLRRTRRTHIHSASRRPRSAYRRYAAVAAILAGLLLALFFLWPQSETVLLAAAGAGPQALELEDGTHIQLNAGSRLAYRTTPSTRQARLTGEAFFAVNQDEKPFEVVTDLGRVTVLGTRFNVSSRADRLWVVCTEGRVRVTPAAGDTTFLLTAGNTLEWVAAAGGEVAAADTLQATDWLSGRSVFRSRPLAEVAGELERQFDLRIVLDPGLDPGQRITTSFSNRGPAADALATVFGALPGVAYTVEGREVSVQLNR